jgi:glucose-6-phosphate isomerase
MKYKTKREIRKIGGKNPDIRYLHDIKRVLYDQKWVKTAPNIELYYMYRGLKEKNGTRYDITVIPPKMLGKEFVKTKGHYHVGPYGEIYIVLKGEAIYLMQKEKNGKIEDVYHVKAKKGDYIIIPPDYAHVTINPSKKELKMANWVSKKCRSDYGPIEKKGGACYFYTKSGWIKNKNYKRVPELCSKKPRKSMPKNLDFLKGK